MRCGHRGLLTNKKDFVMASPERSHNLKIHESEIEDIVSGNIGKSTPRPNPDMVVSVANGLENVQLLGSNDHLYQDSEIVRKRINALRKMEIDILKLESDFYKEVHTLECKYGDLYKSHFEKRAKIAAGEYEPTEEECGFPENTMYNGLPLYASSLISHEIGSAGGNLGDYKGIPGFWLITLKNVDMLADLIEPHDEPILMHLVDIVVVLSEYNPMGYTLEFHFEPNDYFTNSVLTKEYELKCVVTSSDPFSFDGPEIVKCKGCSIDWKKGQNVTVKTIKKRRKDKNQKGTIKAVTKTVRNESFFNFFDPPTLPDGEEMSLAYDVSLTQRSCENSFLQKSDDSSFMQKNLNQEMDAETAIRLVLIADFEVGHFIRERLIPRAVLYYTGEGVEVSDEERFDIDEEENQSHDDDENDKEQKRDSA